MTATVVADYARRVRPDPRAVLSRPAPEPDAVLRYGEHRDHVVDIHLPPGPAAPRRLLVVLHGGFWRQAYDRRHTRPMAHALRDAGYVVATPEYRRTGGDGGWPATFDDVAALRDRLGDLVRGALPDHVAPGPVVLVGHSAGGHLAMWWALTATTGDAGPVVALAPVADLARAHADDLDGGAVAALMGGGPHQHPDRYAAADPAALLRAGHQHPPITVLHGTDDHQVPIGHSRGLPGVALVELPGVEHFALIDPLSAAWPHVTSALPQPAG